MNTSISSGVLRDFNRKCQNFGQLSSKEESSLMITINAVKNTLNDLDQVDRNSLDTRAFFVNLYQLMEKIQTSSMLFTQSLSILELCCSRGDFRKDLVDRYKFPTVLAAYLNRNNDKKTITRILSILNELTYGIHLFWPEPYLITLVQRLFEIIGYKDDVTSRDTYHNLALSVLVNLAYKNPPVIEILFTSVNTEFLKNIQSYGILTNKMYYILGQNSPKDLLASIKLYFLEISKALKSENCFTLRQTIDFAIDVFRKESEFVQAYKSVVNENLEDLLGNIDNVETTDLENIDGVAKLLQLFNVLISLDNVEESQYTRILIVTNRLIRSSGCTGDVLSEALEIFQGVATKMHDKGELFSSLETEIPRILKGFGNRDIHCKTAILKFVRTFVRDKSFEAIFFDHVQEGFFTTIFEGVESLGVEVCQSQMSKFSNDEILFYIICLATLSSFSTIAPVRWFNMIIELFKHKSVQLLIVEGLLRHTEEVTFHIFELAKVVEFPNQEISQLFANKYMPILKSEVPSVDIENHNPIHWSKQQCEKIDEILEEIEQENRNKKGMGGEVSHIIHLCQHQRNVARNTEKNYEVRLQHASDQISSLSHKLQLLEGEIGTLQNSYFSLELFKNNLTAENAKKHMLAEELKRDILNYKTKHDTMKVHYDKVLQTIQEKARTKEAEMKEQIRKLTKDNEETDRKLKAEVKKAEQLLETNRKVDAELQKKSHIIENLTEENKSSHNLIDHLKEQMEEKNTKVKELEDIQNTIINMMQGTKKKKTG